MSEIDLAAIRRIRLHHELMCDIWEHAANHPNIRALKRPIASASPQKEAMTGNFAEMHLCVHCGERRLHDNHILQPVAPTALSGDEQPAKCDKCNQLADVGEKGKEVPHRVVVALDRLTWKLGIDSTENTKFLLNELLDVWDHHSILPVAFSSSIESDPVPTPPAEAEEVRREQTGFDIELSECGRCGRTCEMELALPNDVWEKIRAKGGGYGYLCVYCMDMLAGSLHIKASGRVTWIGKNLIGCSNSDKEDETEGRLASVLSRESASQARHDRVVEEKDREIATLERAYQGVLRNIQAAQPRLAEYEKLREALKLSREVMSGAAPGGSRERLDAMVAEVLR